MRTLPAGLLAGLTFLSSALAQDPAPVQDPQVIPGAFVVRFEERSFDFSRFRNAIYARRPAAEVAEIVADMESAVQSDQAQFVRAVEALGGTVTHQWWIINGAGVEGLNGNARDALAALPNVAVVEEQRLYHPTNNTARNSTHHEADQANQRRNAANELVRGQGLSVAIIDTGVDAQFGSTGKPHPAYYPGGNQSNATGPGIQGSRLLAVFGTGDGSTEDGHGHGSHVSGSTGSDFSSYRGIAPGTNIVGIKISSGSGGSASSASLVSAWQLVATRRAQYNIAVANNSFSGSPSLGSSIQVALDNTALNADVLACCAAGNSGTNTSSSQNVWNGLAVGSLDKNSLAVSSFSGRGPLDGFGRTYPDITAVGRSVSSIRRDSTSPSSSSGTSMASPMAAGGGALVRSVNPQITALEAKALLLNYTKHTQNSRNTYGLGVMDCDEAVEHAILGDYHTIQMGAGATFTRTFSVPVTTTFALTATWMHPGGTRFDNVDMRILNNGSVVVQDRNTLNSYESVDFVALAGQSYTLELTRVGSPVISTLDVAIAGLADTPVNPPSLSNISPGRVANTGGATITLDGQLDRISHIDVGPMRISNFNAVSSTRITFSLPNPAEIGTYNVTVTNSAATSNPLSLQVDGTHPVQLVGPLFALRGQPLNYGATGDKNWTSILFLSHSNRPSVIPNIVNLGIGDNFTFVFGVAQAAHDGKGAATFPFTMPATAPRAPFYFQVITWDPNNLVPPLEVSNVQTTNFL